MESVKSKDMIIDSTWLISFADLVTLILCTFILYFANSQNPTIKVGTKVAPVVNNDTPLVVNGEVLFLRNDVSGIDGNLTERSIRIVKNLVNSEDYRVLAVKVSVCSSVFSESFASNMVTALKNAGVKESAVTVQFFGTACEDVSTNKLNDQEKLVGKMKLVVSNEKELKN